MKLAWLEEEDAHTEGNTHNSWHGYVFSCFFSHKERRGSSPKQASEPGKAYCKVFIRANGPVCVVYEGFYFITY